MCWTFNTPSNIYLLSLTIDKICLQNKRKNRMLSQTDLFSIIYRGNKMKKLVEGYELSQEKTWEIAHVYFYFKLSFKWQTTVDFGIMKDGSLMRNTRKYHCLFQMQNLFQNGANDISEMVNMACRVFLKRPKFCVVRIVLFCSNFVRLW